MTDGYLASVGVVIVGAGASTRFQSGSKVLADLHGVPVLRYSLELFSRLGARQIVVVLGPDTLENGTALVEDLALPNMTVCAGGKTRTDSVRSGLGAMPADVDLIAIHDAARPLVSEPLARRVVDSAVRVGASVPAVPVRDTIVSVSDGERIGGALDRSQLRAVQTPQAFRRDWLEQCLAGGLSYTDEGSALHQAGYPVEVVDGDPLNMKITWPLDLAIAEVIVLNRDGG